MLKPFDISTMRKEIMQLASQYGVVSIKLFGSVSKNQHHSKSDIDFLVEFEEGRSLFDLISLKDELEDLLEKSVDLVTKESIHWQLRDQIINEAIEI
jgi:predicted nucleotidyltransferase